MDNPLSEKWTMDNDLFKKWTVDNGPPLPGPSMPMPGYGYGSMEADCESTF